MSEETWVLVTMEPQPAGVRLQLFDVYEKNASSMEATVIWGGGGHPCYLELTVLSKQREG